MTYTQTSDEPCGLTEKDKKLYRMLSAYCYGKILDYGCNNRNLQRFLPGESYEGVDLLQIAKLIKGVKSTEQFWKENNKYDTIVLNQVLEHCENFATLLKNLYSRLNDDGRLIVCVPNLLSWRKMIATIIGWGTDCDHNHIHGWSIAEMKKLMNNLDFNYKISYLTKLNRECLLVEIRKVEDKYR